MDAAFPFNFIDFGPSLMSLTSENRPVFATLLIPLSSRTERHEKLGLGSEDGRGVRDPDHVPA